MSLKFILLGKRGSNSVVNLPPNNPGNSVKAYPIQNEAIKASVNKNKPIIAKIIGTKPKAILIKNDTIKGVAD